MNIFVLDENPRLAAIYACDKHVIKMTLETAQLLCTARHIYDLAAPYRFFNRKHPCCIWTAESFGNYLWLLRYGFAIAYEYSLRYGKVHKSFNVITWCAQNIFDINFKKLERTEFVQCMPAQYIIPNNPIDAYWNFYRHEKMKFATWYKKDLCKTMIENFL